MKKVYVSVQLLLVLCTAVCMLFRENRVVWGGSTELHILSRQDDPGFYRQASPNVYYADMVTFSNIVSNMCEDGFVVEAVESSDEELDVILTKDEESYRLHYYSEQLMIVIGKCYEKSYIPYSYING